jgi:maltose O-acetyltransferase
MPGVKIAKASIIGAGAVVTQNTQSNGKYLGIPAKLIK